MLTEKRDGVKVTTMKSTALMRLSTHVTAHHVASLDRHARDLGGVTRAEALRRVLDERWPPPALKGRKDRDGTKFGKPPENGDR